MSAIVPPPFPSRVILHQFRKQIQDYILTAQFIILPQCIGNPKAIHSRIPFRKPETSISIHVPGVPQPTAFINMMRRRTGNRVIFSGPIHFRKELCKNESMGYLLDMFPKSPPTKIVCRHHLLVRTIKKGNVFLEKSPRRIVRNMLNIQFIVFLVKTIYITLVVRRTQDIKIPIPGMGIKKPHDDSTCHCHKPFFLHLILL